MGDKGAIGSHDQKEGPMYLPTFLTGSWDAIFAELGSIVIVKVQLDEKPDLAIGNSNLGI